MEESKGDPGDQAMQYSNYDRNDDNAMVGEIDDEIGGDVDENDQEDFGICETIEV